MATREALQEELNPFEIAKQQFNRAADYSISMLRCDTF